MIRRPQDLLALPAALVIGSVVGLSHLRERVRRRLAGERWVDVATVSPGDVTWATEVPLETFIERRMLNRARKIAGNRWLILAHDDDWVLFGYPTAVGGPLQVKELFKVRRAALEERVPSWRWLDGEAVRRLAYELARDQGFGVGGLTHGLELDPLRVWVHSGQKRVERVLSSDADEEVV